MRTDGINHRVPLLESSDNVELDDPRAIENQGGNSYTSSGGDSFCVALLDMLKYSLIPLAGNYCGSLVSEHIEGDEKLDTGNAIVALTVGAVVNGVTRTFTGKVIDTLSGLVNKLTGKDTITYSIVPVTSYTKSARTWKFLIGSAGDISATAINIFAREFSGKAPINSLRKALVTVPLEAFANLIFRFVAKRLLVKGKDGFDVQPPDSPFNRGVISQATSTVDNSMAAFIYRTSSALLGGLTLFGVKQISDEEKTNSMLANAMYLLMVNFTPLILQMNGPLLPLSSCINVLRRQPAPLENRQEAILEAFEERKALTPPVQISETAEEIKITEQEVGLEMIGEEIFLDQLANEMVSEIIEEEIFLDRLAGQMVSEAILATAAPTN